MGDGLLGGAAGTAAVAVVVTFLCCSCCDCLDFTHLLAAQTYAGCMVTLASVPFKRLFGKVLKLV